MNRLADLVWVWRKLADEVLTDDGLRIGYRRCADELAAALAPPPGQQVRDATTHSESVVLRALLESLDITVRRILAAPSARHAHAQLETLARSVRSLIQAFEALDVSQCAELDAEWTDLESLGGAEVSERTRALSSGGRKK